MKVKNEIKNDLKSALRIEEEFSADGHDLEKQGRDFKCNCPFHSENSPSCVVHPSDQYFKCFGCGAAGDILDYLSYRIFKKNSKMLNPKEFVEVLKEGCERAGIEFPEQETKEKKSLSKIAPKEEDDFPIDDPEPTKSVSEDCPFDDPPSEEKEEKKATVYATLEKARDCCNYIAKCEGEKITQWNEYKSETGEILAVSVRFESLTKKRKNGKPKKRFIQISPCDNGYWFKAPEGKQPLFNLPLIAESGTIVLVEGEKCSRFLNDLGLTATNPLGSSTKDVENIDWSPIAGKQVILWPDALDGGESFMKEIQKQLELLEPPPELSVVQLDEYKVEKGDDVVDFYNKAGGNAEDKKAAVYEIIANSQGIGSLAEMERNILDAIAGKRRNIPFPWSKLTELTRALLPGAVLVFAGGEGSTKSFNLLQWLIYWLRNDIKSRVLMCEDGDAYHLQRILAQLAGEAWITNDDEIRDRPEEAKQILYKFKPELAKLQSCIDSPKSLDDFSVDRLLAWLEESAKAGCRVMAIDPITAMEKGNFGFNDDRKFMMGAKRIMERYKASLILVTHPKNIKKIDGRVIIGLHDIAGGLAYTRFAQCVIALKAIRTSFIQYGEQVFEFNRYIEVLKARNSYGRGHYVGFNFRKESLTAFEVGEFDLSEEHKDL